MAERDVERIWELMKSVSFCMLTSWDGRRLHTRPMGAVLRREENAIYFFTDSRAHKDEEIAQYPQVSLGFAAHEPAKIRGGVRYGGNYGRCQQDGGALDNIRKGMVGICGQSGCSFDQSYTAAGRILGRAGKLYQ